MELSFAFRVILSPNCSYPVDDTRTTAQANLCIPPNLTMKFPISLLAPVVRSTHITGWKSSAVIYDFFYHQLCGNTKLHNTSG